MDDHTPAGQRTKRVKLRFRQRYEVYSALWHEAGRPERMLETSRWVNTQIRLWLHSDGGRFEQERSPLRRVVNEFFQACFTALDASAPNWYDELMKGRSHCEDCAQSWLYENLFFCTDCMSVYCPGCVGRYPLYENGNRRCSCGGEVAV